MARPSKYKPEFARQAIKLCELGATDRDIAEFFEVNESTLNRWKQAYPEFCESLKVGKDPADDRVEQSLYRKATGYSFDAEKIFQYNGEPVRVAYVEHVPPSDTACIFWLKNRRPEQWRDKPEREGEGDVGELLAELIRGRPQ
jgi:transposase-like protein